MGNELATSHTSDSYNLSKVLLQKLNMAISRRLEICKDKDKYLGMKLFIYLPISNTQSPFKVIALFVKAQRETFTEPKKYKFC